MKRSRYAPIKSTSLPGKPRSKKMDGSGEDDGVWIRCWNCGFPVKVTRDLGSKDASGVVVEDFGVSDAVASVPFNQLTVDSPEQAGTLIKLDGAGDAITDYYTSRKLSVSQGCPFCGTTNLP